MKKVALVMDNSAGITAEEAKKLGVVKIVPISFVINDQEYYEGQNLTPQQFYEFLKDKKANLSTSQPSIEMVKDAWREVLKKYDEIVYILLSSGLSESCNTAQNASHEPEFEGRVFVVNNQGVSYSNKMAAYQVRELISQGKSAKEIKQYLEAHRTENGIYIAVDTLKYLKKGGRVTPAAAAIGTLLNIKPILQIHGGKLDAYAKVLSMKQARAKMIQATKKEIDDRFKEEAKQGIVTISIAHTMPDENAKELKEFEQEVKEVFKEYPFFVLDPLPLFIACHTGPGALAMGYCLDRLNCWNK